MVEQLFEPHSLIPVSDHEEYTWMLQLQQPQQVKRQFKMWQLNSDLKISDLSGIIQQIVETTPALNVRYIFTEEGDLYKYEFKNWTTCFLIKDTNIESISNDINSLENLPWSADTHPPFFTCALKTNQDNFLFLALHPFLDELYKKSDFIEALNRLGHMLLKDNQQLLLKEIDIKNYNTQSSVSLKTDDNTKESNLAQIILREFQDALREPEMTLDDDFFDFGGHSLLATRIIGNLINDYGIEISFINFFKASSAAGLAKYATLNQTLETKEITPIKNDLKKAPLTLAQDFLWQAYSSFDFSPIYNLPFALEFLTEVDENIFFQAFTDILERHASLRTTFHTNAGDVYQEIVPISELNQYKWFWNSHEGSQITLSNEATYKFNLAEELPLRIRFLRNAKNQQLLSFLVHHMVIDEWSLNIIMSDLAHAYFSRTNNQLPKWKNEAQTMQNYSLVEQKRGINQEHLDYWVDMLKAATKGLELNALDRNLNIPQEPQVKWMVLEFEPDMYSKLIAFARQYSSSIFSVLYTAIADTLREIGQLKDIVIGTSASGRTDPQFFDTVGYFTTMVAHRTVFDPLDSFQTLLQKITSMINISMTYADIPINHIQKALGIDDYEGLLFDVFVHIHSNNALNGTLKTFQGENIPYRQILPERDESMFGLHFEIMENIINDQHQLSMIITYQAHHYPTEIVENIAEKIRLILAKI